MASPTAPVHPYRYLTLFLVLLIGVYLLVFLTGDKQAKPKLGIDLQGGTLTAASDGPGTGSSFTIGLPLAAESPGAELTATPQAASTLRRVFIVDDNHDAAEALAALIGALGHDVRVADNGHDALSVATTWHPDVMLLDIGLPDIDGYEVARRMREIRALDHVQIVACTGYGGDDDLRRMAEAGFDRHLIKPVGIAELDTLFSA